MPELVEYYDKWSKWLLLISIICFLALTLIFSIADSCISGFIESLAADEKIPWINTENKQIIVVIISLLISRVAPISVSGLIYFKWLDYIDKEYWKKRFPQYDISGTWDDNTTYTDSISLDGWKKLKSNSIPSPVIIEQTCHKVKIKISAGKDFTWRSISADYIDGELNILYRVDYNEGLRKRGYPSQRYGYERMVIDSTLHDNKGKPMKMIGRFSHCAANDNYPIYIGDVVYERE